ncbi:UV DNA damage repair endonuclease UvsE [Inediibacterium massiliense]|uniref:UV DNA damage repair endonuclease UvsE n=1 Tax=Inediibacterium massiliense TaxID=1658111 RepID=UPI0006B61D72|nr:UV DNA damage repair endonuclease UvsE [Inediibacterium massiliense]
MIKNIGYACINTHLKPRGFKECRIASVYKYGIDYLKKKKAMMNNLSLTKDILKWNIEHDIYLYRVTSTLLPLVTHKDLLKDFSWRWQQDDNILEGLEEIKKIVIKENIRLSMHPDQFTVLNSPKEEVVHNSIIHLRYHQEVLTKMGGADLIIHTGGVYGEKEASIDRFIKNYENLDKELKKTLRLENDDKSYTIQDVLKIYKKINIPVVLDIHHHHCHQKDPHVPIDEIISTWKNTNLIPKMHISSGREGITDRRHHDYILESDFLSFSNLIKNVDVDLMIEAKEKERAVLQIKEKFFMDRR